MIDAAASAGEPSRSRHDKRGENTMTTDLKYLALTAILTTSLWIPYIIAQVMTNGPLTPANYVDPAPRPVPIWGKRAERVFLNAVESFAPFAALVLVAHVSGKANAMTAFWATSFFWLRLAHAVVYLLAIPYVRTLVFTLGFVAVVGIFWEVIK
jgi:uncharacterized MAPEG superfamily protein